MITRDLSVISMTSQASLSLSLYYSQKSLTHNIGSASALPIIKGSLHKFAAAPAKGRKSVGNGRGGGGGGRRVKVRFHVSSNCGLRDRSSLQLRCVDQCTCASACAFCDPELVRWHHKPETNVNISLFCTLRDQLQYRHCCC